MAFHLPPHHSSSTQSTGKSTSNPAAKHRAIATALTVASIFLLADQFTKQWIIDHFQPNDLIAGTQFLSFVYVTNAGGIFGFAQGGSTLFLAAGILTTALVILAIKIFLPQSLPYSAAFGLLLAGTVGNLVDRLRFGYVIDFITLDFVWRWPSFNIADASIVGGIVLIGLLYFWETLLAGRRHDDRCRG